MVIHHAPDQGTYSALSCTHTVTTTQLGLGLIRAWVRISVRVRVRVMVRVRVWARVRAIMRSHAGLLIRH